MTVVESCDRCGYDRSEWNEQDATRTMVHAGDFLDHWSLDPRAKHELTLRTRRADAMREISASPDLFDQVHHLWHALISIADIRRVGDDVVTPHTGTVTQINVSDGGLPKTAVDEAAVGLRGLDGDRQAARAHHGRPWQAVCLWSADVIAAHNAAGHPVQAGSVGENLTVSGLDWASLRGGTIIDVGSEVRLQLSLPAVPCSKTAESFKNGNYALLDHELHPGTARWYASVLRTGTITTGDTITVSPA